MYKAPKSAYIAGLGDFFLIAFNLFFLLQAFNEEAKRKEE